MSTAKSHNSISSSISFMGDRFGRLNDLTSIRFDTEGTVEPIRGDLGGDEVSDAGD